MCANTERQSLPTQCCEFCSCLSAPPVSGQKHTEGKVKDLKEYKPHIHKQTQPARYNLCVPCSYVHTVSWSLWPLPAGGTRPPPVSLFGGKERAGVVNKTVLALAL